jgi:zinc protease
MILRRLLLALALLVGVTPLLAEDQAAREPWVFETSDVPVDPGFVFGTLPNGLRYVLRENHTPEGQITVRMRIGSGSLAETDSERGLAHFLEHMAFNGSKRVPEGEMVKLLEREGLAFGADTNAATGFEATIYKLDLPRSDPELLDTALMLMRETASELTIAPAAVDRERGVILAERRDRTDYALKETLDQWAFLTPGARYTRRLAIGDPQVLEHATAADIRGYYARNYVPGNAVLVVIGDIDAPTVEKAIAAHFSDWKPAERPLKPSAGPVDIDRQGQTDIYLDPALSQRVTVSRNARWIDEPDTIAQRRANLLREIGYRAVNRRFETLSRQASPPFRGAGYGTAEVFEAGRTTNLVVDAVEGHWREGLQAAEKELRRALEFGFSDAEIAEQVARIRTAQENAAASATTRSNAVLTAAVLQMLDDKLVPTDPQSSLARFEEFAPSITPAAVLAALTADAAPLTDPLIRYEGRTAPEGGAEALRAAWNEAAAAPVEAGSQLSASSFGYSDFGPPGNVVVDQLDPRLGIRELRFANGLRVNLKHTDLQRDRILFSLTFDGGSLLDTKDHPLATALVPSLPAGGLGKHSQDQLESILAGRTVQFAIVNAGDVFSMRGLTTPRDLQLQLELLAAAITDPGYRPEGEAMYRRGVANFFKSRTATPARALATELGGILSDGDPRFTLQPEAAYQRLTFARLKRTIGDSLAHGALELALVGDFDEKEAIDLIASTLGALPARRPEFAAREEARRRSFTADRSPRTVTHTGEPDQALLELVWPTTDDRNLGETLRLELLEKVVSLELTDELREKLGKAYTPSADSSPSRVYRNFGTFTVAASVDVADVDATRGAIRSVMQALVSRPVDADVLERARRPLLETYANALKTNGGWLGLAARAQSQGDRIDRFLAAPAAIRAITAEDLRATAARWLTPDQAVEVLARPAAAKS